MKSRRSSSTKLQNESHRLYTKLLSIWHHHLPYCHPLSVGKVDEAIEKLNLKKSTKAIDLGGGKGEFMIKLIERYSIQGIVVEQPDSLGKEVLSRAKRRISLSQITVDLKGANQFLQKKSQFGLVACINSMALGRDYRLILKNAKTLCKPNGWVVLGLPYWKKPPSQAYLRSTKSFSRSQLATNQQLILAAEKNGMTPLWVSLASPDEIHSYRWTEFFEMENYLSAHPDDPDSCYLSELLDQRRKHFLKWSHEFRGFGMYVFRITNS